MLGGKNLLSYRLVLYGTLLQVQVTLDSQNTYWDGTGQNDGLSLSALEGKVSLHSQSITINARSFILNAFLKQSLWQCVWKLAWLETKQ